MNTQVFIIKSPADTGEIDKAAAILRRGGLVAIPTETVYGLAANALDSEAVKSIFAAKGRPQDNPLIVHIASIDEIPPLVREVDPRLYALADAFWPGPLTVIMPKSELIPQVVSAGLDTVAIRMPSHPVAAAIIRSAGVPLAAPSANASGKPSPTCAAHVLADLDGKIDAVADSGDCLIGVESTVITLAGEVPTLLRPGGVTPEQLESVLGKIEISPAVFSSLKEGEKVQSPGMKYKHYSPKARVTIVKGSFEKFRRFAQLFPESAVICFDGEGKYFDNAIEYGGEADSLSQSHGLFAALRKVDETGCKNAYIRCPDQNGVGLAVYNRLLRAAAFKVLDLDKKTPLIGLTGQTGSGKTTVSAVLAKEGCAVINSDLLARRAVENPDVLSDLKAEFGDDIVSCGVLNRRLLAARAFASNDKTKALNRITHPEITRLALSEAEAAAQAGAAVAILDAPVLLDSPLARHCGIVASVVAPLETRIARITARDGISREQALERIGAQADEEYYKSNSDIIIINDGSVPAEKAAEKLSALIRVIG